jgi:Holliday junction resolvase-like predicted endonuclease
VNMTPTSEIQALERIARKYKREGYELVISPSPSELPKQLRNFEIDIIARRGAETVVVEVKRKRSDKVPAEIQSLAELVNALPHHRFDFVAIPRETIPAREEWLDLTALSERVEEASQCWRQGHSEAAIMLLWSATEGALRFIADRQHLGLSTRGPQTMVKTLYSQGVIDKYEYEILEQAGRLRNLAVHGFKARPDEGLISRWQRVAMNLLSRAAAGRRDRP